MSESAFYFKLKKGIKINIKVVPNSAKNEICGVIKTSETNSSLKIKISAVADDGKANKMLIKFLSNEAGISQNTIELLSGHKSRAKTIMVTDHKILEFLDGIR